VNGVPVSVSRTAAAGTACILDLEPSTSVRSRRRHTPLAGDAGASASCLRADVTTAMPEAAVLR
jgi:hypothetical protein